MFSYPMQQQQTISWLDCDVKLKVAFIWWPAMTSSVVGWRGSSKALPKAKLAAKKGHGHRLVVCCLSESRWNHYIWDKCSANWWDAPKSATSAAGTGQKKGPILLHNNAWPHVAQARLQKLTELGCEVLPHLPYSPDFLKTNYLFFKHLDNFLQENCFHNQEEAENASQEFVESQSIDFYATGINKLISHWKKCVDCNGSYFD